MDGHLSDDDNDQGDDDDLSINDSFSSTGSIPPQVEEATVTSNPCWCFCTVNCRSKKAIKPIRSLNAKFKENAAPLLTLMEWRKFPSEEQTRSRGQNYLVCKMWVLTYALLEVKALENQVKLKESPVADCLAELLGTAELMGVELVSYGAILLKIKRLFHNAIAAPINDDFEESTPQNVKLRFDVNPYLILGGKTASLEDFTHLRAGLRDLKIREWCRFTDRKDGFYLISTGLREMIEDCRRITKSLKVLHDMFEKSISWWKRRRSIRPTLSWIRRLNKRADNGKTLSNEEVEVYDEALDLFEHLMYYGDLIVLETMKLLLMTRLCYMFIKTGQVDHAFCINLDSYNKVLSKKYCEDLGKLIPWANFNDNDWYQVMCPEALRRVPVLISDKYELGLFHEDYQRIRRKISKAKATNMASLVAMRIKQDTSRLHGDTNLGNKAKVTHRDPKFSFNLRRLGSGRVSRPIGPTPATPRPSDIQGQKL